MLEVLKLGCIRGERRLFSDLSFSAGAGELIELRGPNGSGKTSLLRILCGLSSPAAGQVRWNGKNIRSLGEEYFRDVAYLAQQNLPARALSAGQRRRLALARLLTSRARLWLLDEVLTSLDNEASKLSAQFISDHLKNNGIAIVATHQDLNLSAGRTQCIQLGPSNNTDGISAFPEAS